MTVIDLKDYRFQPPEERFLVWLSPLGAIWRDPDGRW